MEEQVVEYGNRLLFFSGGGMVWETVGHRNPMNARNPGIKGFRRGSNAGKSPSPELLLKETMGAIKRLFSKERPLAFFVILTMIE